MAINSSELEQAPIKSIVDQYFDAKTKSLQNIDTALHESIEHEYEILVKLEQASETSEIIELRWRAKQAEIAVRSLAVCRGLIYHSQYLPRH